MGETRQRKDGRRGAGSFALEIPGSSHAGAKGPSGPAPVAPRVLTADEDSASFFHVSIAYTHVRGPLLLSSGPGGPLFLQEEPNSCGQMLPESREGRDPRLSDSRPHQLPDIRRTS